MPCVSLALYSAGSKEGMWCSTAASKLFRAPSEHAEAKNLVMCAQKDQLSGPWPVSLQALCTLEVHTFRCTLMPNIPFNLLFTGQEGNSRFTPGGSLAFSYRGMREGLVSLDTSLYAGTPLHNNLLPSPPSADNHRKGLHRLGS